MKYIWILIAAAALAIICMIPVCLKIEYAFSLSRGRQKVNIYINKIKVPTKEKTSTPEKKNNDKKPPKPKKKKTGFSLKKIGLISENISELTEYLCKKTKIKSIVFHADFGLDDAAATGVAAGVVYGCVYTAAGVIYSKTDIKKEKIDICINPHFDAKCAEIYASGIFRFRIVHIINIAFKVLNFIKKINK